ncbi:MAG: PilZ domain-containing protein [Terriglobales bacterium]
MPVEALLLSQDAGVLRVLRRVLDEIEVQMMVTTAAAEATAILGRRKFDAVIIDCDDIAGSAEVIKHLRQGASNKAAIVFSIVNGATGVRDAFDLGANFVLEKPLSAERVQRSFRAAHGLMIRERRRYFRHEVEIPVVLDFDGDIYRANISNLSEGGFAVLPQRQLPKTGGLRVTFTLPDTKTVIDARGELAWNTGERAGIRLLFMQDNTKAALTNWLAQALEKQEPAINGNGTARAVKVNK